MSSRVILTDSQPTEFDQDLVDYKTDAEKNFDKELAKRKLKVHEFGDFTFYYSEKEVGIEDTKRQTRLLNECSTLLKSGRRTLRISELSADAQATVRGLFLAQPGPPAILQAAAQQDFVISAGLQSTFSAHLGSQRATYKLVPDARPSDWATLMNKVTPPVQSGASSQNRGEISAKPDVELPIKQSSSWTFVCPATISSLDRLRYISEIQTFLQAECVKAKVEFDAAARMAQKAIYSDFAGRYDMMNKHDGTPQFQNLSPEDKRSVSELFRSAKVSDPLSFLSNCITDSVTTDFSLSLYVPQGIGASVTTIPIGCPVKP